MHGRGPDPDSLNTHRFETERLLVDLPRLADADRLFAMIGGPDRGDICATLLWDGPDDRAETEDWIQRCATETFGEFGYHWVVRDRSGGLTGEPGQAMGAIGTRPRGEPGRADVGYWLGKAHWGRDLMSEALRELIRFGFEDLDYYKIEADVYTINPRGLRLVESAGMRREGVVTRAHRKYGAFVDKAIYGLLREDWLEGRSQGTSG